MWSYFALLILSNYVYAITDEEVKMKFTKMVLDCAKTHPVDMNELMEMQALKLPKSTNGKCLLACAYKKDGIMTEDGTYNLEHGYKMAELCKNGEEKRLVNGKKLADICSKVNDAKVSDGKKGCERAALMFTCVISNAPKLGFKV